MSMLAVRFGAMPFLSEIRHRRVLDAGGDPAGRLLDLAIAPSERIPVVRWAILGTPAGERVVRWSDLAIEPAHLRLRRHLEGLAAESLPDDAIRMGRDLLDQPVHDSERGAVVRVNDLQLEEAGGELRLVGADVGWRALWRRIGVERVAEILAPLTGRRLGRDVVPWHLVDAGDAIRDRGRTSRS